MTHNMHKDINERFEKFGLSISQSNPFLQTPDCFENIAEFLLHKTIFHINHNPYRIVEVEFYLYSETHPDVCTHCHACQLQYETWYFHRASKKETAKYKGGTFKGLDITFGDKEKEIYGGILIRSIYDTTEHKVYEGPCRTVNRILEVCGKDSITELVDAISLNVFDYDMLFLSYKNMKEFYSLGDIVKGPRIGLTTKKPGSEEYVGRHYRYAFRSLIKKQRKTMIQI